ncbi:hypothetical protein NPIL_134721 [Nephila pilipes]|uniref:Uncharacterized protein n=1 Tax=Nephila pilipes TaxID=299642 RepID=A0A8X6QDN8_NEPPI|nr:hypothetical protein NPIL_134721 [Nephila pilipes]
MGRCRRRELVGLLEIVLRLSKITQTKTILQEGGQDSFWHHIKGKDSLLNSYQNVVRGSMDEITDGLQKGFMPLFDHFFPIIIFKLCKFQVYESLEIDYNVLVVIGQQLSQLRQDVLSVRHLEGRKPSPSIEPPTNAIVAPCQQNPGSTNTSHRVRGTPTRWEMGDIKVGDFLKLSTKKVLYLCHKGIPNVQCLGKTGIQ